MLRQKADDPRPNQTNARYLARMVTTSRTRPTTNRTNVNDGRDPDCPDPGPCPPNKNVDDDVMPYGVKRGDTLAEIAKAHDTTVDELLELNPALKANPNKLRIGQEI